MMDPLQQDYPAETLQPAPYVLEEGRPRPFDVLFGRGRGHQEHPGNVVLQGIVKLHRERYQRARRKQRNGIAQEIVQNMKHGGPERQQRHIEFLKRVGEGIHECWVEVSDKDATEKVCHALRVRPPTNNIEDEGRSADSLSYGIYSSGNTAQSYNQMRLNQQQSHQVVIAATRVSIQMPTGLLLDIAATMNQTFIPPISPQKQLSPQQQSGRPQGVVSAGGSTLLDLLFSTATSQAAITAARNPQPMPNSTCSSSSLSGIAEETNTIYYHDQRDVMNQQVSSQKYANSPCFEGQGMEHASGASSQEPANSLEVGRDLRDLRERGGSALHHTIEYQEQQQQQQQQQQPSLQGSQGEISTGAVSLFSDWTSTFPSHSFTMSGSPQEMNSNIFSNPVNREAPPVDFVEYPSIVMDNSIPQANAAQVGRSCPIYSFSNDDKMEDETFDVFDRSRS
jgi:hypothetical protein